MKFLTDENIGFKVIYPLRELGFDVKSMLEIERGSDDTQVFDLANKDGRILITTDKDFGELVYVNKLVNKGVVLLRLRNNSATNKLEVLKELLKTHKGKLEDAFTVVKEGNVRVTQSDERKSS